MSMRYLFLVVNIGQVENNHEMREDEDLRKNTIHQRDGRRLPTTHTDA